MNGWKKSKIALVALLFFVAQTALAAYPASLRYELKGYGFGSGGTNSSSSDTLKMNAITGEVGGANSVGGGKTLKAGLAYEQQANVPPAPTVENQNNSYSTIHVTLNAGGNPSTTEFAIAASTDNFSSDIRYVQNDNTLGDVLGMEDRQTYAVWGGSDGFDVIGLAADTTYYFRVKAMTGSFTETGWGPAASDDTSSTMMSFDIDVSDSDEETGAPYALGFSNLSGGTINDSSKKIWVDFSTNAAGGGKVYVVGANSGLASSNSGHKIDAVTGNLSALDEGFGAQGVSATQQSGGPLVVSSPYNSEGNSVGVVNPTIREIFSSSGPVTDGRGSFVLKAKPSTVTPAATDYTDTLTLVASSVF